MDNSPFSRLAPELRNYTFELAVTHEDDVQIVSTSTTSSRVGVNVHHPLALAQTCRQIRAEARAFFFTCNSFSVTGNLDEAHQMPHVDSAEYANAAFGFLGLAKSVPDLFGQVDTRLMRAFNIHLGRGAYRLPLAFQSHTPLFGMLSTIPELHAKFGRELNMHLKVTLPHVEADGTLRDQVFDFCFNSATPDPGFVQVLLVVNQLSARLAEHSVPSPDSIMSMLQITLFAESLARARKLVLEGCHGLVQRTPGLWG
jgi:hypothetical protein